MSKPITHSTAVFSTVGAAVVASLVLVGSVWASASPRPRAGSDYIMRAGSSQISGDLETKSSGQVVPDVQCDLGRSTDWAWGLTKPLTLRGGSVAYDKETTIQVITNGSVRNTRGHVTLTASFANGRFSGSVQLAGTPCHKAKYTAAYGGVSHI